jgi:ribosomal protein L24
MSINLQPLDRVQIIKGRAKGITGMVVTIKDNQDLPFLVRFNNSRRLVGYTAKELRKI